jgi:DNA-binding Lrp family transcriptional regulator
MVTAFTMLNVIRDQIHTTAQQLLEIEGVTEVYSVAGEWDLVAVVRVRDNEQLAEVVTTRMLKLGSITRSQTLISFRVYSNYQLDAMFELGE